MKKILALLVVIGMGSAAIASPITVVNGEFADALTGWTDVHGDKNEVYGARRIGWAGFEDFAHRLQ